MFTVTSVTQCKQEKQCILLSQSDLICTFKKISFPITQGNYLKLFENNTQVKLELNVLPTTLARVNPPPPLILHSFSIESNCLKIISLIILQNTPTCIEYGPQGFQLLLTTMRWKNIKWINVVTFLPTKTNSSIVGSVKRDTHT